MAIKLEKRSAALRLIAALTILFVSSAPALAGSEAMETTPLYQAFESRYEEIQQAVKRGALPDEANTRAQDLWLLLRKDLIGRNARIDILRLEATQYTGERQQRALDELVRETADREGMIASYLGKLDRIAAKGGSGNSVIAVPDLSPRAMPEPAPEDTPPVRARPRAESTASETEHSEKKSEKTRYKLKDIEIEIGPEDIINEEQHMP